MRKRGLTCGLGWLLAWLVGGSLAWAAPMRLFTFTHPAMGTEYTLEMYSRSAGEAEAVSGEVFEEIDRVDALLSNYKEASELSRINHDAAAGAVTTDAETMDFLTQSLHWSAVSDGAFDITVGRLMKAWGFYRHKGAVPPDDELVALRAVTGWEKVVLDARARTVRFTAAGVELDPGGIGKGFGVDAAVRILRADGVKAAMISAGGSTIYALGTPPGKAGWRVVVPDLIAPHTKHDDRAARIGPPARGTRGKERVRRYAQDDKVAGSANALSVVTLRDTSLSSADCTQKNFTVAGHLYCHIMDPRTMRPAGSDRDGGRVQVSVIDPSATASDALSNVVFVGTPEESVARLAKSAPEARALIVSVGGRRARCTAIRWGVRVDGSRCDVETHR